MAYRVAVVTPYRRERDDWLRQCLQSVRNQSAPCTHIIVADGEPQDVVAEFPEVQHIVLPVKHDNFGDTPRAVACMSAAGQEFDAICFLDADNWFRRDHVRSLLELHDRTGAVALSSKRSLHATDGVVMAVDLTSDGEQFTDTNCLMLMRPAFAVCAVWGLMSPHYHPIGDRVIWQEVLRRGLPRAHSDLVSACYRVTDRNLYQKLRWPEPPGVKEIPKIKQAVSLWRASGRPSIDHEVRVSVRPGRDWSDLTDDGPLLQVRTPPLDEGQRIDLAPGALNDQ